MKIGTIFKYLIYFICVILFSCKKTEIRENAKEDVDEAIKYTQGIYKIVSEEKWDSLNGFISERFKLENGRQIFSQINNLVGKIIETKIKNVKTTYKNTNGKIEKIYAVDAKVKYEKGNTTENFNFETIDTNLVIVGYHINMDLK